MEPIGLLITVVVFCAIFYLINKFIPEPWKVWAFVIMGVVFLVGILKGLGVHSYWPY